MNKQEEWLKNSPHIKRDGKLPSELNLERALTYCELSQVAYRHHNRNDAVTIETLAEERKLIEQYAQVYGYHAKVFSTSDQQAVVFYNDREIVVAFEGSSRQQLTHYNRNLMSYLMSWFQEAPRAVVDRARVVMGEPEAVAKVHWGFDNALNEKLIDNPNRSLWDAVKAECNRLYTQQPRRRVNFTGHSSGGALATIAAARMFDQEPHMAIDGLYTFGQPRVGGKYFRAGLDSLLNHHYYRFEQFGDPMPALPPYNAEEYVHGGHWIPMDLAGHVLEMNDLIINSDTLSRSDQYNYGRIQRAYYSLMSGIGGMMSTIATAIASKSSALSELIELFDPIARRTHSSLRNVFSLESYDVHRCAAYSRSLFNALEKQADHDVIQQKRLLESEGAALFQKVLLLFYKVESLEERLAETSDAQLPENFKEATQRLNSALRTCLNGWERLKENNPDPVLRSSPAFHRDADDSYFGLSFSSFFSRAATKAKDAAEDEATFVGRVQPARHIRRLQRASRVEELNDALNQFRHDIGRLYATYDAEGRIEFKREHGAQMPIPNDQLPHVQALIELADEMFEATVHFQSRMGHGSMAPQVARR